MVERFSPAPLLIGGRYRFLALRAGGKMLDQPISDEEGMTIKSELSGNCFTLSIYNRDYLRELKAKMADFDEKAMNLEDEQKIAAVTRTCAPVLRAIADGHELGIDLLLFDREKRGGKA